jgi:hypothetical protein
VLHLPSKLLIELETNFEFCSKVGRNKDFQTITRRKSSGGLKFLGGNLSSFDDGKLLLMPRKCNLIEV